MAWGTLLDLLFPATCCGCGSPGAALCAACSPAPNEVCAFDLDGLACGALGPYAGALRRAVLACKRGRRDAAATLSRLMAERLGPYDARIALVPVLTTRSRAAARGFDQAVALARGVAAASGVPVLAALRRTGEGVQRGRSRAARLTASGRFAGIASVAMGRRVLLVDDVATTGATLCDAARALRDAGADVLGAVVAARASGADDLREETNRT